MPATYPSISASWPFGTGVMAGLVRAHDWAATALGPAEGWPGGLRQAVALVLASPQVASVVVGPARVLIYNDAAAALYGDRHPGALGRPVADTWPEGWAQVRGFYDRVFAGESVHVPAQPLDVERPGAGQVFEAYLTPVRDDGGAVIAGHMTGFEVGARLRAEAALTRSAAHRVLLLELSDAIRAISEPTEILQTAMRLLGEHLGVSRAFCFSMAPDRDGWVHVVDAVWQREPEGPAMTRRHDLSRFGERMFDGLRRGEVVAAPDVEALAELTAEQRENYRALGVRAFIKASLLRGGAYRAGIGVHDTWPRAWTPDEATLMREVAARSWAAAERAETEAALRESTQSYQALFSASPVPFLVLAANAPDFTIMEANDAYLAATLTTREGLVGRRLFDVFTDDPARAGERGSMGLAASLGRVLATRQADAMVRTRYDIRTPEGRFEPHWWLAINAPVLDGSGQVGAIIHQVTRVTELQLAEKAAREDQARQAFLLGLSDGLRPLSEAGSMQAMASRLLGEHLGVDRVAFCDVTEDGDTVLVAHEWARGGMPPGAGRYRATDFGPFFADALETMRTATMEDAAAGGGVSLAEYERSWALAGVRAAIAHPVMRGTRLTGALFIHSAAPRRWVDGEVALVKEVADRTWNAIARVRAEAAMQESEARFRALAQTSPLGVGVSSLNGQIIYTNQAFDAALGYERGELLGQMSTLVYADVADRLQWQQQVEGGGAVSGQEVRFRRKDGTPIWVSANIAPIEFGGRQAVIGVIQDVTARRRIAAALRESEERLRQFGEASQDVLWIRDATTLQWTYLTPAFEAIYGLSRAEALTGDNYRNWLDLVLPEDRAHAVASIERVGAGARVTFEYRIRRPVDGTMRWLRDTDFPMRDGAGRVRQIGGVGHDVTELKAVQAAMAESERRLRALTEGIPQLVWRSCDRGWWTWCSPQWIAFTGQTQEESHGLGWLDAVHPDDRAGAVEAWSTAGPLGRMDVEYRVRRASDGTWLWHRTRSLPEGAGGPEVAGSLVGEWLGTTTDIDDLKRLQGQQQVLVAELQHRTRNLLAVVRNVARRSIGPSAGRDMYDSRLAALGRVQGFLSRSAGYTTLLGDVVAAELEAVGNGVPGGAPGGVTAKVSVDGPAVDLPGESVQVVALALHELATNALKYGAIGQKDGRLRVSWRIGAGPGGGRRLEIDWWESGVAMEAERPARQGYGTELITRALPYQLGAETALEFTPDGVRCRIVLPGSAFGVRGEMEGG